VKDECARTLHRAYLFLDGELLSPGERAQISTHLEACRPCYERYGLDEVVTTLVARLKSHQRCPDDVRLRIQTLLF
jgi:mycothiol system anti-sigma-R factor